MNVDGFAFTGQVQAVNTQGNIVSVDVTTLPNMGFQGLTGPEITAAAIIHELLHAVVAIPHDHGGPGSLPSSTNSERVRFDCF
jgi:glycine cleavage system protein P-like pyridoxal-binding family